MTLGSFVIIEKENCYLLIRESSKKWKGKWYFPGGHLNCYEDPVSAVIRETKEEAQCDVLIDGVFYFCYRKKFLQNKMHVYFHGRTNLPLVKEDIASSNANVNWFTYEELIQLPLREDALQVIDIYRALPATLPIYCFNFQRAHHPHPPIHDNPNAI